MRSRNIWRFERRRIRISHCGRVVVVGDKILGRMGQLSAQTCVEF